MRILTHRGDGTSRKYPKKLLVWHGPRKPWPESATARYKRLAEELAGTPEGDTYATLYLAERTYDAGVASRPRPAGGPW